MRIARHKKVYIFSDQMLFAKLSGDFNPMHVNPVVARRQLFGEVVVHGIRVFLDAIDLYIVQYQQTGSFRLNHARCHFKNPVLLSSPVYFIFEVNDESEIHATVSDNKGILLSEIFFSVTNQEQRGKVSVSLSQWDEVPEKHGIENMQGLSGQLQLAMDVQLAGTLFKKMHKQLDAGQLASIIAFTRLVGMKCPGLSSIFSSFQFSYIEDTRHLETLEYAVSLLDKRFSMVDMTIDGPGTRGTIKTFVRPLPQRQSSFTEIVGNTGNLDSRSQIALIVGGSRGIGEVTAKVIAACGGHPILTYLDGKDEAEKICAEIKSAGFRCDAIRLDVSKGVGLSKAIKALGLVPNAVYYFASPKIFVKKGGGFDVVLHRHFVGFYLKYFNFMYLQLRKVTKKKLVVFYPSTVAIDERLNNLMEYAMAKLAGEEFCKYLEKRDKEIKAIVKRLPRTATDQTLTLNKIPAESALAVVLPVVREVQLHL